MGLGIATLLVIHIALFLGIRHQSNQTQYLREQLAATPSVDLAITPPSSQKSTAPDALASSAAQDPSKEWVENTSLAALKHQLQIKTITAQPVQAPGFNLELGVALSGPYASAKKWLSETLATHPGLLLTHLALTPLDAASGQVQLSAKLMLVTWAAPLLATRPAIAVAKTNPFALVVAEPARPVTAKPAKPVPTLVPPPAPVIAWNPPPLVSPTMPAAATQLPAFQYLGQATDPSGEKRVLLLFQRQPVWVQRGSTFEGQFELTAIDGQKLVFKQLSSGVLHSFNMPALPAFDSR